ncbi:MAG: acylneuraminate cytidylyltransferase family protein [Saprospiraceae bacterium]|nr:acylneuraminate cytidylyltransferase family protein [Saprospiraceae bacterium]
MKVLGVIPARGGSKGVPGKNIRILGNMPLIAHTIEAAGASKRLHKFIVSTDDKEIALIARQRGAETPFMRPAELATDSAKAIPVMQHALLQMEQIFGFQYDALIMLQPTTPFRTAEDIDNAIEMLELTGADSVISVVDVGGHHPARMKYINGGQLIDPPFCEAYENQPRQELTPVFIRNGAIYLTRRKTLMSGSFKGKDCRALVMKPEQSVNIDSLLDFDFAAFLFSRKGSL